MTTRQRKPNTAEDGALACAFGEAWLGPHPLCRAETARVCACAIEDVPDPDLSHLAPVLRDQEGEWTLT